LEDEWSELRAHTSWAPDRFTSQVYHELVAGKPRMSGARAALEHFGFPPEEELVREYADRKQRMVVALIEAGRFTAFADALRLLLAVRDLGIPVAAASSSKNAHLLLSKVRLEDYLDDAHVTPGQTLLDVLDVDISGRTFERGKPDPEIFLAAARELGVAAARCFVVEDAPAGIEAAKRGGMAALGIARDEDAQLLRDARADLVLETLDDLDRQALSEGRLERAGSRPGGG
jgi:beta-phosphoglucomutase-like phosphatase (HAD superfamily)